MTFGILQEEGLEYLFALGGLFFVVLLLGLVILVLNIIVVVQAHKAGREGWWVYLIALFIGPLNLVAIILWFAYAKKNPILMNGKPFL